MPFTVIFFDHGPVTLSATVYVPSSFTSSQLACPSGTLISTSFVSALVSVVVSGFFDSEESFLVSVVLLVSEAFVEEVFSCVLDSLFTLTVREGTGFVLLVVHVRTEKMIISVRIMASAMTIVAMVRAGLEKNSSRAPKIPRRRGRRIVRGDDPAG